MAQAAHAPGYARRAEPRLLQKDKGEYAQKNDTADNRIRNSVSDASFVRRLGDFRHGQSLFNKTMRLVLSHSRTM
jgi:hypothetical protein